jgi:DNA-directed RNA polymerase specialized sigma24 family protein
MFDNEIYTQYNELISKYIKDKIKKVFDTKDIVLDTFIKFFELPQSEIKGKEKEVLCELADKAVKEYRNIRKERVVPSKKIDDYKIRSKLNKIDISEQSEQIEEIKGDDHKKWLEYIRKLNRVISYSIQLESEDGEILESQNAYFFNNHPDVPLMQILFITALNRLIYKFGDTQLCTYLRRREVFILRTFHEKNLEEIARYLLKKTKQDYITAHEMEKTKGIIKQDILWWRKNENLKKQLLNWFLSVSLDCGIDRQQIDLFLNKIWREDDGTISKDS